MPIVEVAFFKASKAFNSDTTSTAFDKTLDVLKGNDGYSSVHHGSELDDQTRKYVIVVRDSARNNKFSLSTLESELNKLGVGPSDDLSISLFHFDADPTSLLDSPLPELWYTRARVGYTAADVIAAIEAFYRQIGEKRCGEIRLDDFPPWCVGLSDAITRPDAYVVGWESDEARRVFEGSEGFREYAKGVFEIAEFESMPLSLVKV